MKHALREKRCTACQPGTPALSDAEINLLLPAVSGWDVQNGQIFKTHKFKDYHHTMAFVNAVAWLAHRKTIIRTSKSATTAAWCDTAPIPSKDCQKMISSAPQKWMR
jgi:hypothetical protein